MEVVIKGIPKYGVYNKMELFVAIFLLQYDIYTKALDRYKYVVIDSLGKIHLFRSGYSLGNLIKNSQISILTIE